MRKLVPILLPAFVGLLMTSPSNAQQSEVNLKVGDKAPTFESVDDQGKLWKSADHVGKKIVVVYFYPADMTGGCTKQACGFRDDMKKLKSSDVEIIGVSGDSAESHALFKKAHDLNFTLLADEKGAVAKKFGVPLRDGGSIQRKVDGKEVTLTRGVTAKRWTFVIGKDGKVAMKNTKVKAARDSKAILAMVSKLGGSNASPLGFKMKSLAGKEVDLAKYKGKVVMMVNVASECGLTPQYKNLQGLHEKYADAGLAILGFPCNQFGGQEPGEAKAISEFCTANYGVKFDMFSKVEVNGDKACDLYKHLTSLETKPKGSGRVSWNFEKFLIGRDGKVIGRFSPPTKPDAPEVLKAIETALKQK